MLRNPEMEFCLNYYNEDFRPKVYIYIYTHTHTHQDLLSFSLLSKTIKMKIYRTIILPVVLYGCETWSFTLREEGRLRVFENRVLRMIFGPERDEEIKEVEKTT